MHAEEIFAAIGRLLKSKNVPHFEIYYLSYKGTSVEARQHEVDSFEICESRGICLRIFKDDRMGFSYHFGLDKETGGRIVEDAIAGLNARTEDEYLGLPEITSFLFPELLILDPAVPGLTAQMKIATAMQLEKSALDYDDNIQKVRKASFDESQSHIMLYNSEEVLLEFSRTNLSCTIQVMASNGNDSQMGWEFAYSPFFCDLKADEVGSKAARKAVQMLGARRIASTRCALILDNFAAAQFLGVFMPSFFGERVIKGKSLLAGRQGEQLLAPCLTVIDDGTRPKGAGSSPIDGEGQPSKKNILIEDGVVQGFLFDTYWGKRAGTRSTGNACRSGLKSAPSVNVRNIYIQPAGHTLESLIKNLSEGLLITDIMGIHTADTVSGDFSVGIAGYWIEAGSKVHPVNGVVLSGNIIDLFTKVEAVGDDLRFFGPVGAPCLLVGASAISGL